MQGSLIEQYNEEKAKHFYNIDFGTTEEKPSLDFEVTSLAIAISIAIGMILGATEVAVLSGLF